MSDTVYCLSKDSTGRLWMGTNSGISIYDGSGWTQITSGNGLPNDTVTCILHTTADTWIGTNHGLVHYNGNWTYYNTSNSALPVDSITALATDGDGLWVGTYQGLVHFDGTAWTLYNPLNSNLTSSQIRGLTTGPQALFIGTLDKGYFAFRNGQFIRLDQYIGGEAVYPVDGPAVYKIQECMIKPGKDAGGNIYFLWGHSFQGSRLIRVDTNFISTQCPVPVRGEAMRYLQFDDAGNMYFSFSSLPFVVNIVPNSGYINILSPPVTFKPLAYWDGLSNNFLAVNHVKARINVEGDMHWDPLDRGAHYTVPDTVSSVYASALWIGGIDENGIIHQAAHTYRQEGSIDYWAGPLDTVSGNTDSLRAIEYSRIWNVRRDTLNEFIRNYINGNVTNGNYIIPEVIVNWPAHGIGNISRSLAPYIDNNGDGIYNPYDGDYPDIKGDQMLWWVFNDTLNEHTETNAPSLQIEVHASAWAYNCSTSDTTTQVLDNTTFYRYEIFNRSLHTYDSVYIGLWMDPDLGNAADDYDGCDTLLNTGFVYNGDNNDEGSFGYGLNPPVQNVTILNGPLAYSGNNYDDNHDGVTDEGNEKTGLSHYLYYVTMNNLPVGEPFSAQGFYNYLSGSWLDGQHWTYGEGGRNPSNPPTNYMFSGTPYDTIGWTMVSAFIQPDDMRMVLSSGPFHLGPGEMQSIDFAYIFTRDTTGPNGLNTSIRQNRNDVSKVISWYNNNAYPCFIAPVEIPPVTSTTNVYPNPSSNIVYLPSGFSNANVQLFDVNGKLLADEKYTDTGISIAHFAKQLIIFRITNKGNISYAKVVKM